VKRYLITATLAVLALASSACTPTTPYAATVNGHVIESRVIEDELHAITSNPRYAQALDAELANLGGLRPGGPNSVNSQYAASLVYEQVLAVLIHDELVARNLTVTPDAKAAVITSLRQQGNDPTLFDSLAADYRDHVVTVQTELQAILDSRSTPADLRKYYDEHASEFNQTCFRQVPIVDPATAEDIRTRLQAGGDFVALAKEAGGPDAQPASPEPSCATDNQLNETARKILADLKINDVTEPVRAQSGFILVQVVSRKQLGFEESEAAIKEQLADRQAFFAEILGKAKIKVNPRYGDFVPADPASGRAAAITPHEAVVLPDDAAPVNDSGTFSGDGAPQSGAPQSGGTQSQTQTPE